VIGDMIPVYIRLYLKAAEPAEKNAPGIRSGAAKSGSAAEIASKIKDIVSLCTLEEFVMAPPGLTMNSIYVNRPIFEFCGAYVNYIDSLYGLNKNDPKINRLRAKQELYNKFLLGKGLNPIVIKAVSRKIVDMDEDYSRWKDSLVNGLAEDLFQTLPILDAAQRVAYLKESLYFYRWNPASISRNIRPDYYYAYRTVYQRTDEYLKKWGFEEEKIHRIMQGRINMIFGVLLAEHQPDRKRWLQVLSEVSDDPFFRELWQKRDKAYICKYYMLMGQLILKKQFLILQIVKKTVEFLVRIKKYIQRSN